MNISTGGPHILFFERDQQMATLLSSEFQLAGYECHTARTAVEVFDAIARYSVRILLVNLAQAAAGRREFWVALDTQRRGRGVQVYTYQCKNIAGYGPSMTNDDLDERPYIVKPDIEVDGMLGVMNLLEAVKRSSRPSGSNTGTNAGTGGIPRISATPVSGGKTMQPLPAAQQTMPQAPVARESISERTAPLQAINPTSIQSSSGVHQLTSSSQQAGVSVPAGNATRSAQVPQFQTSLQPQVEGSGEMPQSPPLQSASERMRAVIYPGQQSGNWNTQETERQESSGGDSGQKGQAITMESGLDQLSRMVEEQQASKRNSMLNGSPTPAAAPLTVEEITAPLQTTRPADSIAPSPASSFPLRTSPIQDIPSGRDDYPSSNGMRSASLDNREHTEAVRPENAAPASNVSAPPATPLSVLASMMEPAPPAPVSPTLPMNSRELSPADVMLETTISKGNGSGQADGRKADEAVKLPPIDAREESANGKGLHASLQAALQAQQAQAVRPQTPQETPGTPAAPSTTSEQAAQQATTPEGEGATSSSADTTLLDIMQSLPPMASPPAQQSPQSPQPSQPSQSTQASLQASVLSGRATRSLGRVLLEGHLVPQDRLEVAENIQRMLRGVDMNYQLGEILLMFKLLTPDQLLAASLVSYGLLTTAQIRALGRIRQELHSIGLEYDLENLLILFRILSPEQLREVRASWNS